jgi:hypothetical protein
MFVCNCILYKSTGPLHTLGTDMTWQLGESAGLSFRFGIISDFYKGYKLWRIDDACGGGGGSNIYTSSPSLPDLDIKNIAYLKHLRQLLHFVHHICFWEGVRLYSGAETNWRTCEERFQTLRWVASEAEVPRFITCCNWTSSTPTLTWRRDLRPSSLTTFRQDSHTSTYPKLIELNLFEFIYIL